MPSISAVFSSPTVQANLDFAHSVGAGGAQCVGAGGAQCDDAGGGKWRKVGAGTMATALPLHDIPSLHAQNPAHAHESRMPTPYFDTSALAGERADGRSGDKPLPRRSRPIVTWLLAVIAIVLVGWAMRSLAVVVVPFIVAIFVTLAVLPIDRWVAARVGRRFAGLGHLAAILVVILVLSGFFAGIYFAAYQAVGQLPDVTSGLQGVLPDGAGEDGATVSDRAAAAASDAVSANGSIDAAVRFLSDVDLGALYDQAFGYAFEYAGGLARGILNTATALIAGIVLVIFLVLLMLVERETWQAKAEAIFSRSSQAGWNDTFAMTARSFRWFIVIRTALGVASGALYAGWLAIFGVELLLVWFVLAFLFNYIPTIGSILAALLPALYVLATQDWTTALIVAAGLIAIEQVLGNYIDPMVQGKQLSVSPVVTFFALLLFGWMWGIVGALLATPIVVFAVIALAHIDSLKPLALILSDAKDMKGLEERTYR